MTEQRIQKLSTLRLTRRFVNGEQRFHKIQNASFLLHPILFLRRKGQTKQSRYVDALQTELMDRYKGIFFEMGSLAGVAKSQQAVWPVKVLLRARQKILTLESDTVFPTLLWGLCASSLGQSNVVKLKPKFMLRQFMEELPNCRSVGVLFALAYMSEGSFPRSEENRRHIERACGLLHDLLTRRTDLDVLTDNVLSFTTIEHIIPPYSEYKTWLFVEK